MEDRWEGLKSTQVTRATVEMHVSGKVRCARNMMWLVTMHTNHPCAGLLAALGTVLQESLLSAKKHLANALKSERGIAGVVGDK